MDIRQLKYFISVAEHLSFTKASKQLFVAQSAVSQQIADLEKKIGVKLFVRDKRSVKLTNAGSVLLKEALNIVSKTEEAIEKTRQAELGMLGSLSIGFLGYSEKLIMPHLIRQFRGNYPKINLELDQYSQGHLLEALNTGELDVGFTFSFAINQIDDLKGINAFKETISVVMNREHPLANKDVINITDLSNEKFIVQNRKESPQGYAQTLSICSNNDFYPNIVAEPRLLSTVLLLVDTGIGIAILPKSLQTNASSSLKFVDIKGEKINYDLVVAWKKTNNNPSISLFLKELEALSL